MIDKIFMILPSFEEINGKFRVIKYDSKKGPEGNSKIQRDNAMLQVGLQILRNKHVCEDSQTPGTSDKIEKAAKVNEIISKYFDIYYEEYREQYGSEKSILDCVQHLNISSLKELNAFLENHAIELNSLELDTFIKFHNDNMSGATLIGIYANNNTMQAKLQNVFLKIADRYTFKIDGKLIKNLTDVYTDEEVDGKHIKTLIARNCAQFSFAAVDNVKNPILAPLMQNRNTANITCFMLRAGMRIDTIGAIFNSPLVKKSIESHIPLALCIKKAEEEIAKLYEMDSYEVPFSNEANTDDILSYNAISNVPSFIKSLSDTDYASVLIEQVKTAKLFMHIQMLSKILSDTVKVYRADSPNGAIGRSKALAKLQTMALEKLIDESSKDDYPIEGINKILQNNYLNPNMSKDEMRELLLKSSVPMLQAFYSLGIDLGTQAFSDYFVEDTPYVDSLIDFISDNTNGFMSEGLLNDLYNAIKQFALSDTQLFGQEENMSLAEKRAYYLYKFPLEFKQVVQDNPDIAALPFIQKLNANFRGINMRDSARNSTYLKELLMSSADDLLYLDNPKAQKLAMDLFRYVYFNEGFKFGPDNFSTYFSTIFKSSFPEYVNTLRDLIDTIGTNSKWDRFITQFFANHPSIAPIFTITDNQYTDDSHSAIEISSSQVINPKLLNAEPYSFIATSEAIEGNEVITLYKLVESTRGSDIVTYRKIETLSGNIYDMNKDSNDLAAEVNKYKKVQAEMEEQYDKRKTSLDYTIEQNKDFFMNARSNNTSINDIYSRINALDPSTIEAIDAMEASDDPIGNFDSTFGEFDPSIFDDVEAKIASIEEFNSEEGLKEEDLNPCKKPGSSNSDNIIIQSF